MEERVVVSVVVDRMFVVIVGVHGCSYWISSSRVIGA